MKSFFNAEFFVALSFVAFIGLLIYLRVHHQIGQALDDRQARIRSELDEARRLRDEAEKLVAEYRRKQHEAESEAQAMIASANAEAERIATEAKARMEEFVARRTRIAETKISQAEAQALADVRAAAADAAVSAAERILTQTAKGKVADRLIGQGIKDVAAKLN
jgi:F-type H+-transporting ATPase subunit b